MRFLYSISFWAIFCCSVSLWGQGEADNWYFGKGAGVHFRNDGTVVALTDGRLNTNEGCTTISDASGNLLFYTDGITVYDKNHQVMLGGTGLYGDPSSTQSALIVPKPEDPNIFFIFTVDTSVNENDPDFGLNYSVVDISENGGNGRVILKNQGLLANCSEKITAVIKDCFEKSIWLVTFASETGAPGMFNTYHAFEINKSGVVTTSVKSTFSSLNIEDPRGYLKFSADGEWLASANMDDGLYLYNFDATTGVVSNQLPINIKTSNKAPYGVEFSPNNQFLYVVSSNDQFGPARHSSSLIQYDLQNASVGDSEVVIRTTANYRGALQLGSNGKIYRTIANSYTEGTTYLGVIQEPDKKGDAANYQHNAVNLKGKLSMQGLPPFIQSFFNKTQIVKNADGSTSSGLEICNGETIKLEAGSYPGATYTWKKDQIVLPNTNETFEIITADLLDAGKYSVEIILADPSECPIYGEATVTVFPLPEISDTQLVQCDLDDQSVTASTDGLTAFNLEQAIPAITNDNNNVTVKFYESVKDRNDNNEITNPIGYRNTTPFNQIIYSKVTDKRGCENFGTLELEVQPALSGITNGNPRYTCNIDPLQAVPVGIFDLDEIKTTDYPGLDIAFYSSKADVILEQNEIKTSLLTTKATEIYVRKEIDNVCVGVDQVNLYVEATPVVNFPDEHTICTDGNPVNLAADYGFDAYRWYKRETDGSETLLSSNRDVFINLPGNYRLELGYLHGSLGPDLCWNSSDFKVLPSNKADIREVEVKDLRENNTITVLVSGDGAYEYALNDELGPYQDSNTFENVPAGISIVYVRDKNGCGVSSREISVIGYPRFFTPNGDLTNEYWQILGIGNGFQPVSSIYIFDRYGAAVAQVDPTSRGWDGTSRGVPLPSSDYWFRVLLKDGRELKGHFTLKR